jgi:hypothetical protein
MLRASLSINCWSYLRTCSLLHMTSVHTSRAHAKEKKVRLYRQQPKSPGKIAHAGREHIKPWPFQMWPNKQHSSTVPFFLWEVVLYLVSRPWRHPARCKNSVWKRKQVNGTVKTFVVRKGHVRVIVSLVNLDHPHMTRWSWLHAVCVQYKNVSNSSNRFCKRVGTGRHRHNPLGSQSTCYSQNSAADLPPTLGISAARTIITIPRYSHVPCRL